MFDSLSVHLEALFLEAPWFTPRVLSVRALSLTDFGAKVRFLVEPRHLVFGIQVDFESYLLVVFSCWKACLNNHRVLNVVVRVEIFKVLNYIAGSIFRASLRILASRFSGMHQPESGWL